MTIDEQQRFELHVGLRQVLGDDVAGTLMEHLPPSGWSDVARARDLEHLREHFDATIATMQTGIEARFVRVDDRFTHYDERVDERFKRVDDRFTRIEACLDSIVRGLWAAGTVFAGSFVALFSLIATKL